MQINVRPGEPKDAQSLAQFQIAMALETESKTLDPQVVLPAVQAVFDDASKGHYYVAEIDGKVVGCLMITFEWSDWRNSNIWYIQSVFVDSAHRGRGIFKTLYRQVVEAAKQQSVRFVRLYVECDNAAAQSTYESLGMSKLPYYMYQTELGE